MNENLKEWSLRMAMKELGQEIGAGGFGFRDVPVAADTLSSIAPEMPLEKVAFSRFVELMRRKKGLTVEQLADACDIEVAEIISIEDEALSGIGPRTVFQIAKCFNVSESKLMQIAGLRQVQDANLAAKSLRFAARSNSMASLTKEEREALEEFVAHLGRDN